MLYLGLSATYRGEGLLSLRCWVLHSAPNVLTLVKDCDQK